MHIKYPQYWLVTILLILVFYLTLAIIRHHQANNTALTTGNNPSQTINTNKIQLKQKSSPGIPESF
jgi:hypothetical protein